MPDNTPKKSHKTPRILIMAGGTGGHVFPALAIAQGLQAKGWAIDWLGTKQGLEADIVPKACLPLHTISIEGLRRSTKMAWVLAPIRLMIALLQSLRLIFRLQPDVVLGMGGFVTGPGGIAAKLLGKPLVIHEQNAIVGTTNACLAPLSNRVLEGFPGAFRPATKAIHTGNPVRAELLALRPPLDRFRGRGLPLRLLVLGGSRGAMKLNELCPLAIKTLPKDKQPEIWHQAGGGNEKITEKAYKIAEVNAKVTPFIQNMAEAYAWADIVVCRAGALTVAELMIVGMGSLLIPFPFAVDDHQTYNGRFLEKAGAAFLFPQVSLTPELLGKTVLSLTEDRNRLVSMAEAAYGLAKRDAVSQVMAFCEEVCGERKK